MVGVTNVNKTNETTPKNASKRDAYHKNTSSKSSNRKAINT